MRSGDAVSSFLALLVCPAAFCSGITGAGSAGAGLCGVIRSTLGWLFIVGCSSSGGGLSSGAGCRQRFADGAHAERQVADIAVFGLRHIQTDHLKGNVSRRAHIKHGFRSVDQIGDVLLQRWHRADVVPRPDAVDVEVVLIFRRSKSASSGIKVFCQKARSSRRSRCPSRDRSAYPARRTANMRFSLRLSMVLKSSSLSWG